MSELSTNYNNGTPIHDYVFVRLYNVPTQGSLVDEIALYFKTTINERNVISSRACNDFPYCSFNSESICRSWTQVLNYSFLRFENEIQNFCRFCAGSFYLPGRSKFEYFHTKKSEKNSFTRKTLLIAFLIFLFEDVRISFVPKFVR